MKNWKRTHHPWTKKWGVQNLLSKLMYTAPHFQKLCILFPITKTKNTLKLIPRCLMFFSSSYRVTKQETYHVQSNVTGIPGSHSYLLYLFYLFYFRLLLCLTDVVVDAIGIDIYSLCCPTSLGIMQMISNMLNLEDHLPNILKTPWRGHLSSLVFFWLHDVLVGFGRPFV